MVMKWYHSLLICLSDINLFMLHRSNMILGKLVLGSFWRCSGLAMTQGKFSGKVLMLEISIGQSSSQMALKSQVWLPLAKKENKLG
ncbi:hypothetical protein Leryth_020642 [Lithospermum erythrorhizon]|nr:hypothetical protein Leryth_020642 [Lithospermum erythrorhizon]